MKLPSQTKFATFPQRLFAFNIDFMVFLLFAAPLSFFIENDMWFWIAIICGICIYHAACESSSWQATIGKKYSHIQVVDEQGKQLSFPKALLRIITKHLSLLLFFTGFFMIYFRRDRRGLHDVLSKTYVVNRSI